MGVESTKGYWYVLPIKVLRFLQPPIGVHLTGKLDGWATPKDLILHLAGKLTVRVSVPTYSFTPFD